METAIKFLYKNLEELNKEREQEIRELKVNLKLDNLTLVDITYELEYIKDCIQETGQIQQIEQEKFETKIEVRPKVDCRMQ